MESDFFEMYERQVGLSLECGHNSIADWVLVVREKKKEILYIQDPDRRKVFAEAYHLLAEYLSANRGGY